MKEIKDMSIEELKVAGYDCLRELDLIQRRANQLQQTVQMIDAEIVSRNKVEEKAPETA
jgi:hypothetical protein